jgi:hypothetical protein
MIKKALEFQKANGGNGRIHYNVNENNNTPITNIPIPLDNTDTNNDNINITGGCEYDDLIHGRFEQYSFDATKYLD